MYQDVDVSDQASEIDAGSRYLHLSGWLANYDQYPHDRSTLAVEALDGGGAQLLYLSRHHRSPSWTHYRMDSQIPSGSRTLRVYLIATRYVGSDNDGYFDDLYLAVDDSEPDVLVTVTAEGGTSEVEVDSTLQLNASSTGGDDPSYDWSSSFEAVATVDENGLVTAHRTGRVVIQAEGTSTHGVGHLEIIVFAADDVIFDHPQAREAWVSESSQNITWELKGSIDSGTLSYSTTGGSEWIEIAQVSDLATGEYSWSVPTADRIMNDCLVKMVWDGGEASSGVFVIEPAAQGGGLSGRVSISIAGHSDLSVVSASVSLQGTDHAATTGESGEFSLSAVPVGDYVLLVTSPGLIPVARDVTVAADQDLQLDDLQMTVWINGSIGLDEAIYALEVVAGIRGDR